MTAERWLTWLLGREAGAQDGSMRGLLIALWSFLQRPGLALEDHFTALEERLSTLETRLVGDFKVAIDTGMSAAEETIAGAERRLEEDFKRALSGRLASIHTRLETVRNRVVDDLKHELHRMVLTLALVIGCGVLAAVGMIFGLMAAWTGLRTSVGGIGASLVLAIAFLLASLVVLGLLRSVRRREPNRVPV